MRRFIVGKRALILAGLVTLALAGVAVAFFTSTGSGTGAAEIGSLVKVTLHGNVASSLYPGTSSTVTFTVDNPSPGSELVSTIHLASITPDAGHSGCSTVITGGNPDFTMPDVVANQSFPSGNGQAVTATGTLTMNETGVSQNACQGATLTLNLTSS
jgi:hypothetical protein